MKIKLTTKDICKEMTGEDLKYPLYTGTLINQANRWSKGTVADKVGQMSELVPKSGCKSHEDWKKWYMENYPNADEVIEIAVQHINEKIVSMKDAIENIDETLIRKWVEDLMFIKTFYGIVFHEAILKKVASVKNMDYKIATPEEESKNIDGYIGDMPVSIKPSTFKESIIPLSDKIEVQMIYYTKDENNNIIIEL